MSTIRDGYYEYLKRKKEGQGSSEPESSNGNGNDTRGENASIEQRYYQYLARIGKLDLSGLGERIDTWVNTSEGFTDDYNSRYFIADPADDPRLGRFADNMKKAGMAPGAIPGEVPYANFDAPSGSVYNNSYKADSEEWELATLGRYNNLLSEAEAIKNELRRYALVLDAESVSEIEKLIDDTLGKQKGIADAAKADREYWTQWGSEEEYNENLAQKKELEDMLKADTQVLRNEIEKLEKSKNEPKSDGTFFGEMKKFFGGFFTDEESIANEKEISDKKAYLEKVESLQKLAASGSTDDVYNEFITQKEAEGRTWFNKEAWDSVDSPGRFFEVLGGSAADIGTNIGAGLMETGEKLLDGLMTVAPIFAQGQHYSNGGGYNIAADTAFNQGIDAQKKATEEFVAKDLYDSEKIIKDIFGDADKNSIFGEKIDSLAQSGGQLAGTIGLSFIPGVGGAMATAANGIMAFGGEAESAFRSGASYEDAVLSASITAAAEVLTEQISGGIKFGGKTLDDGLTDALSKGISNKVVRTLTKWGIDTVGEGSEEIISGVISDIGQELTYGGDGEISSLAPWEWTDEQWEEFIGGAVLGGVSSGSKIVADSIRGIDPVTGITKNEQKVVDRVVSDLVAETEKESGKKLTAEEKSEIEKNVLDDLEKGRISIDTIEEVLGGEAYKKYSDEAKRDQAIRDEYESLGSKENPTLKDQAKYSQLGEDIAKLDSDKLKDKYKSELGDSVFNIVKGTKLSESYNQRAQAGKYFEADVAQYKGKARETVQAAIDSKIINNTRRSHELVDLIAKISEDKGITFDFTNNQRLKESGFSVEGATVNGYVQNGKVTINTGSQKYLNAVVGHEVMHVLRGSEFASELTAAAIEFAKAKGEYDSRYNAIVKAYAKVEGFDVNNADSVNAELVADLVGDYLFTDSKFLKSLSAEKPGLFKRLWDEVKHFCKWATAGSPEARKLVKLEKAFAKAYKDTKKASESGEVRYSVGGGETQIDNGVSLDNGESPTITAENVQELRSIGRKSINAFTSEDIKKAEPWARKFYAELGTKSPFFRAWFGDWRAYDTNSLQKVVAEDNKKLENGRSTNKDTQKIISWNAHDIISETKNHAVKDKVSVEAINQLDEIIEKAVLLDTVISEPTSKSKMPNTAFMHSFYTVYENRSGRYLLKLFVEEALSNNEKTVFTRAYQLKDIQKVANLPNGVSEGTPSLSDDKSATIDSIADLFTLVKQFDKEFSPKDVNPLLLNEDGTPKVFYHGTNEQFTVFDPAEMSHREGSYFFAENKEDAAAYGDNIFEVYLSAENLANYDDQPREFYKLKDKRAQVEWLKERGYDGWYADMDSGGWGEVSVFDNTQIKSATDNIGTFDGKNPDIRYSVSADDAIAPPVKGDLKISGEEVSIAPPIGENVPRYRTEPLTDDEIAPPREKTFEEKVAEAAEAVGTKSESKQIINIIHENIESISDESKFDVTYSDDVSSFPRKADYVMDIFTKQGNVAENPKLGTVELNWTGAKNTIMHGYGHAKLAAVSAIKSVIETGDIVSYTSNYKNTDTDRYVIAAKGTIDGSPAYIGVVIKSYPKQNLNNKFYLHEAEIVRAESPVMTGPLSSVDTVSNSADGTLATPTADQAAVNTPKASSGIVPNNIIPDAEQNVKGNSENVSESKSGFDKPFENAVNRARLEGLRAEYDALNQEGLKALESGDEAKVDEVIERLGEIETQISDMETRIAETEAEIEAEKKAKETAKTVTNKTQHEFEEKKVNIGKRRTGYETKQAAQAREGRVYSRGEALQTIKGIEGATFTKLSENPKIVDALWALMNKSMSNSQKAQDVHSIANYIASRMVSDSAIKDPDAAAAQRTLLLFDVFKEQVEFKSSEAQEIRRLYGSELYSEIVSRWQETDFRNPKKHSRMSMSTFIADVSSTIPGMEYISDMEPVRAIAEIEKVYNRLLKAVENEVVATRHSEVEEDVEIIAALIEESINDTLANGGEKSQFSKKLDERLAYLKEQNKKWRSRYQDLKAKKDTRYEEYRAAREKTRQAEKEKMAEKIDKAKESARIKVENAKKDAKDRIDKYREDRERTQNKKELLREIGRLQTKLFKSTKEKHIHYTMEPAVAEAMSKLNLEPEAAERLLKYYDELEMLYRADVKDEAKIAELQEKCTKTEERAIRLTESMNNLLEAYKSFANSKDSVARDAFDADLSEKLDGFVKEIGNTPIYKLNGAQMKAAKDFYKMLMHRVNNANKTYADTYQRTIDETARQVIDEVRTAKIAKFMKNVKRAVKLTVKSREFIINDLKPPHFFELLSSPALLDLYEGLHRGELVWARDIDDTAHFLDEIADKYHYFDWDQKSTTEFRSANGHKFELTVGQAMYIYALSKRETNSFIENKTPGRKHLEYGGFKFKPDTKIEGKAFDKYLNDATRYTLGDGEIAAIINSLTAEQKAFADALQKYMSEDLARKGNEVSRKLYGVDLFTEKNYITVTSVNEYKKSIGADGGEPKIKNKGMTKPLTVDANNPIILEDIADVFARHAHDMALYHGVVLPIEDISRVLNYGTSSPVKDEVVTEEHTGDASITADIINKNVESGKNRSGTIKGKGEVSDSLKQALQEKYGDEVITYIEKLLVDINGGVRAYNSLGGLDKLLTNFKKVSTMASMSVFIQQFSSLPRAMSEIDAKYFVGLPKLNKLGDRWEILKKYAPIAIIKEMGGFDTGTGQSTSSYMLSQDYKKFGKVKGFFTDSDYRDASFGYLAGKADEITWIQIFEACCREQLDIYNKANGKKISMKEFKQSDELMQKAADRFDRVITRTQVYDSVLSRSAHMRSKDGLAKTATTFMAEPTTVLNMLAVAAGKRARGEKGAGKIIASVVTSTIINSLLASLVYAARDDDEEKTYGEKYWWSVLEKTAEGLNPLSMVPIARDIMSIIQGYDVERSDMTAIADLYTAVKRLLPSSEKDTVTTDEVFTFIASVGSIFGIPTRNIYRDAKAAYNIMCEAFTDEYTLTPNQKEYLGEEKTNEFYDSGMSIDEYWKFQRELIDLEDKIKDGSATYDDILTYMNMSNVRSEADELYSLRDDILDSKVLSDKRKQEAIEDIREDIREINESGFDNYGDVTIDGVHATVGDSHYRLYTPKEDEDIDDPYGLGEKFYDENYAKEPYWKKLSDDELKRQNAFTKAMNCTPREYWEHFYALSDIEADRDENGKAIANSKKGKVIAYLNSLDASYEEKILLYKYEFPGDDRYNIKIIDYLNGRADISLSEMEAILEELGFKAYANDAIAWK